MSTGVTPALTTAAADDPSADWVVIDLRESAPPVPRPSQTSPAVGAGLSPAQAARRERLVRLLADLDGGEPGRVGAAREELVLMHTGLVEHIARRYRDRGEPLEDLVQVGMLALVKCAQRFDPGREVEFSTYATATVAGEIKRHFRDRTWAVHVPRRMQELRHLVVSATEQLTSDLGCSPSQQQVAEHLGIPVADVAAGLACAQAYRAVSLEAMSGDDTEDHPQFACEDGEVAVVEARHTLLPLLKQLPERERRIVVLRYFNCWSQSAIAEDVGISQMHVSRLLARALERMRAWAETCP